MLQYLRPKHIIYDNDSKFKLHFNELCKTYKIKQKSITVKNQGDGLPNGEPICRLIMYMRATNELMLPVDGDLDYMALPSQFLLISLTEGEIAVFSGQDLTSSF